MDYHFVVKRVPPRLTPPVISFYAKVVFQGSTLEKYNTLLFCMRDVVPVSQLLIEAASHVLTQSVTRRVARIK